MNKKLIKMIAISLILLGYSSCITDLDLDNLDKESTLKPSIVMPLGVFETSLLDIVKDIDSASFGYDEANNYAYLYLKDTVILDPEKTLGREFSDVENMTFEFSNTATPGVITPLPFVIPNGTNATFNVSVPYDLKYNKKEGGEIVQRVDSMVLNNATFKLDIQAENFNTITTSTPLEVTVSFPNITSISDQTYVYTMTSNTLNISKDFNNLFVDFSANPDSSITNVHLKIKATGAMSIANSYKLSCNLQWVNINYAKAWGYFNRTDELTGDKINVAMPNDFFKSENIVNNRLLFHNPTIKANLESNIGIPMLLNVKYIKAMETNGNKVFADFNGSQSYGIKIPQASQAGPATTQTVFDKNNGATNKLFTINPDSLEYQFGVVVDNDKVNQGGEYAKHFIVRPAEVKLYLDAKLPFYFDPTSTYSYYDTIALDDKLEKVINKPDELEINNVNINFDYENGLPVQAIVDVICLNELGQEVYRKEGFNIEAPTVNGEGFVTQAWKGKQTLIFQKGEITKIMGTTKIVMKINVKGKDSDAYINIRLTDYIKSYVSLFAKGSYTF